MHRFHLPPENWNSRLLSRGESHHAIKVLRLGAGERVEVFDGAGRRALATLAEVVGGQARVVIERESFSPSPACALALAQALPKGKNMDWIVQKATELGAARIQPLLTRHTVVDVDNREAVRKQEKWQATALEACKQCRQDHLPVLESVKDVDSFIHDLGTVELRLVASLQPGARSFHAVLKEAKSVRPPQSVVVAVGPEGDFSPREIERFLEAGFLPVTLGPIVLRTETAALYCLSVLAHELLTPE